jgi:hypothetical protein
MASQEQARVAPLLAFQNAGPNQHDYHSGVSQQGKL